MKEKTHQWRCFQPSGSNCKSHFDSSWAVPLLCINWQIVKSTVSLWTLFMNTKGKNVLTFVLSYKRLVVPHVELMSPVSLFQGCMLVRGRGACTQVFSSHSQIRCLHGGEIWIIASSMWVEISSSNRSFNSKKFGSLECRVVNVTVDFLGGFFLLFF